MKNFSFNSDDAAKYGVVAATILHNIRYWLHHNKIKGTNKREGRFWVYYSVTQLQKIFPFLTDKQIRFALEKLTQSLLIKGNYNKSAYDRTTWYAYRDEHTEMGDVVEGVDYNDTQDDPEPPPCSDIVTSISPKGKMNFPKRANKFPQKGEPIPNINTDIKKDINTEGNLNGCRVRPPIKNNISNDAVEIIEYLNEKAQRQFKPIGENLRIVTRLLKNYTLEQAKMVIDSKVDEWLYSERFSKFLRPETLFKGHFEGYLNAAKYKPNREMTDAELKKILNLTDEEFDGMVEVVGPSV